MSSDFVARLGSRVLVPGEVTSGWGLPEYVALTASPDAPDRLAQLIADATARRRMDPDRLRAVLTAMAQPPMPELNRARIGALAGAPPTTLPPYVDLLVEHGVIRLLPGCRSPVAQRAIGRPRVVFDDVALLRHLAGHEVEDLLDFSGRRRLLPLLTNMVAAELLRQQQGSAVDFRVSYLRERNGLAVDLVIELADGGVYGIEVRTAASLRPHQFSRLRALAARAGSRFRGGVVLTTAARGHHYGYRLMGLPISSVW